VLEGGRLDERNRVLYLQPTDLDKKGIELKPFWQ
jgi:hypothetical protein